MSRRLSAGRWMALLFMPLAIATAARATVVVRHDARAYASPGVLDVHCSISWEAADPLLSVLWIPQLPPGWEVESVGGDGNPEWRHGGIVLTGEWPEGSLSTTYRVRVPAGETGAQFIRNELEFQQLSMENSAGSKALPDPLEINPVGPQLQVQFGPADVGGSAAWSLAGSTNLYREGDVVDVPPGAVTILFRGDESWTAPQPVSLVVSNGVRTMCQIDFLPGRMAYIPGGTFMMGRRAGTGGRRVFLDPFYMDLGETSLADFALFCATTGCAMPDAGAYPADSNRPVARVNWKDARDFAAWRGKALPTEAQWEFAARGGLPDSLYPWGDAISADKANYGRPDGQSVPAGAYPPNGYGLLDMAGNVWEWCADWYAPVPGGTSTNPAGPSSGSLRVVRGGSYASPEVTLQNAIRHALEPDVRYKDLGFRCVAAPPVPVVSYHAPVQRRAAVEIFDADLVDAGLRRAGGGQGPRMRLRWTSNAGCRYAILRMDHPLAENRTVVADGLPATPPVNVQIVPMEADTACFVIIELE